MTAIQILKEQHRSAERLIDRILRDETTEEARASLFDELSRELRLHQRLEEELLYPAAKDRIEPLAGKAEVEHDLARTVLEELSGELGGDQFRAKLLVLRDLLLRHVDVEEKEFFPKVETLLGVAKLQELSGELRGRIKRFQSDDAGDAGAKLSASEEAAAGHA